MREGAIVVTGGAGFVGSHLVERLLAEGRRVVCVDNFAPFYSRHLKRRNLARAMGHPGFRLVEVDVCSRRLRDALEGEEVSAVVHLAARPGVRQSFRQPAPYLRDNVVGTLNVASLCRQMGVRRLVLASSSSVYGITEGAVSEDAPCRPISPYGASKLAAEAVASVLASQGTEVLTVRLFTVYGPRQRPDMAIARFAASLLRGRAIVLYGDGLVRRDFTYIDDAVDGLARALQAPVSGFQVFNIGGGQPVSVRDAIGLLESCLGRRAALRFRPLPEGDPPLTWADIGRAQRLLGYRPRIGLAEGLERYADWLRQEGYG